MAYAILSSCIGCTACARQCPTEAIHGSPDQVHQLDPERCTDCGVCGMVCPIENTVVDGAGAFAKYVPRFDRWRPRIDLDLCNGCGACVDICPFGCLSVEGPRYAGVAVLSAPDACVSCRYCQERCLKGAIR